MKVSHHIILLSVVCFIGLMQSTNIYAQETTTREERIKQLQLLQSKYDQVKFPLLQKIHPQILRN